MNNDKMSETSTSVHRKIDEIAELLYASCDEEFGLYSGNAGRVLFLFYYARYKNSASIHQRASELIDHLFSQVEASISPSFSFCSGIAGVGWLLDHLCKQRFLLTNSDDVLSNIDGYLYQTAVGELSNRHYDFIHGAMGMVFYLIKRYQRDYLRLLVQLLDHLAVWDDASAKWESVIKYEEGVMGYSIALSHGCSSLALILCKILQIMPEDETTIKVLRGTIRYICNQEISVKKYGCYFPAFSIESQPKLYKTRLAWCYGDLGIAFAIWKTGVHFHIQALKEKGMEILCHAAERRGLLENDVVDAGICHGTAGLAQIFNRMFRNTQRIEFQRAANYWCMETLNMAKFEDGLAGYKAMVRGGRQTRYNLLEGIAGIGLSLLSFVMPEDPAWDECLLLS